MGNQALILAGGFGSRLGEITKETPKPILPVGGIPFLEYVLWNLKRHGLTRILISTGYLSDRIEAALGDGSKLGIQLQYCVEADPLGTGGATALAAPRMEDEFLVLNGDTLFEVNYWALWNHKSGLGTASIALRGVPDVARYGGCVLEGNTVVAFSEKGTSGPGIINAGNYVLDQELVDRLPKGQSSLERDLFPILAKEGMLAGLSSDGFFIDIGLPETLIEADDALPRWRAKPCCFLDRDGVLNVNNHHTFRTADLQWIPGSREGIRWLNDHGYLAIVVTNQAGIGKGIYSEAQFQTFMAQMKADLREVGAHLDAVYFCPYHPTEGIGEFLYDSPDRKPNPGMILRAAKEWNVDVTHSFLVGDKDTDMQAAERAGLPGIKFEAGDHLEEVVKRATSV